jgi:hypothetical protein
MIRTQIQLTEEQSARLHEAARRSGVSSAELIRRSLDRFLEAGLGGSAAPGSRRSALEVIGRFHSGQSDISSRHDDYLDEAYATDPQSLT